MKRAPDIRIIEAHCTAWGKCWHADSPYYTGHYKTREMAAVQATKRKREMIAKGRLEQLTPREPAPEPRSR